MSRKTSSILVQDVPVTVMSIDQRDYISLTDMAKARTDAGRAADVIKNWLRARSTLEFVGTWEIMYNPDFKVVEFDHFKSEAGLHTFTLSAKTLFLLPSRISEISLPSLNWLSFPIWKPTTQKWSSRESIRQSALAVWNRLPSISCACWPRQKPFKNCPKEMITNESRHLRPLLLR